LYVNKILKKVPVPEVPLRSTTQVIVTAKRLAYSANLVPGTRF